MRALFVDTVMGNSQEGLRTAITSLVSILREIEVDVKIKQFLIDDHKINISEFKKKENEFILEIVKESYDYDYIFLSAWTGSWGRLKKIAMSVKEKNTKIKIVAGGPHVDFTEMYRRDCKNPLSVLHHDCPYVDIFIYGESEQTLKELFEESSPKGISYKSHGKLIYTGWRELIQDLDNLPFPNMKNKEISGREWAYIESSRGCLYNCSFCSEKIKWSNPGKRNYRHKSPKRIVDEIEYFYSQGIKNFRFTDSSFTSNPNLREILKQIIRRGFGKKIRWSAFARINEVLQVPLEKMVEAGCETLLLGFESGSQKNLDNMHKGYKKSQAYKTVSKLKKYGIKIRGSWIISQDETEDEFRETLEFAKALQLDANTIHTYENQPNKFESYQFGPFDFNLDMPNIAFSELVKSSFLKEGSSEMHYLPRIIFSNVESLSQKEIVLANKIRRFYAEVQKDEDYDKMDKYDRVKWRSK